MHASFAGGAAEVAESTSLEPADVLRGLTWSSAGVQVVSLTVNLHSCEVFLEEKGRGQKRWLGR
jgi:hypothetical protein